MTWFKVDDKLHDHRKTRAARKAAMGVWVLAGSWSADHLTDGFIPRDVLSRWGTTADARALVAAGLWTAHQKDGEAGWLFRDWDVYQPTKAEVEAERAKKAEAGRKGGRASGASRREARASAPAHASASSFVEPPTRPVPTTAAAAAEGAAAAAGLPGPIDVLRSKLQAHTPLRGLRFDTLTAAQADQLVGLLEVHGDDPLVTVAIATCRNPAPVHASAFLGTWAALPAPGRRLQAVKQRYCDTHSTPLSPSGTCSSCASDQKAAR